MFCFVGPAAANKPPLPKSARAKNTSFAFNNFIDYILFNKQPDMKK